MSLFDLTGKVAVVTGSSRGIGKAIALRMAEQGARVVISSRKQDACQAVADEINAAYGADRAVAIAASISHKEALAQLISRTNETLGPIDVMVCNAASNPYYGPMAGISDDQFRKIMDNNILSNHWLVQLVAPQMVERRDGAIIIVSSIGGLKSSTVIGAYNVSKAADMQLARKLCRRVRPPQCAGELHRAGPDPHRLRQGPVGEPRHPEIRHRLHPAPPDRRAGRDRGRGGLPRLGRRALHHRPCAGGGRRPDHLQRRG